MEQASHIPRDGAWIAAALEELQIEPLLYIPCHFKTNSITFTSFQVAILALDNSREIPPVWSSDIPNGTALVIIG